MPRTACLATLLGLTTACAGARLRGAESVPADQAPKGTQNVQFLPSECSNAAGIAMQSPGLAVRLSRQADGKDVLLEERPGYDSVVVSNFYDEHGERTFAYVANDGEGHRALHLFVPFATNGAARLAFGTDFETEGDEHVFRAHLKQSALRCSLTRVDVTPP